MDRRSYANASASYITADPHSDRIARISEKINMIQTTQETGKKNQMEVLNGRIKFLEDQMAESNDQAQKKIKVEIVKDQIIKIKRSLEEEKNLREGESEQWEKDVKLLERKIGEKFELIAKQRAEMEKRLREMIDDRTGMLQNELMKESAARAESIDYLRSCLENDIPKLQEGIKGEALERQEAAESLAKASNDEILVLQSKVMQEKKAREETEEAMLEMLKDMVGKMKGEIESERKERESTEETLLGLLEETCTKVSRSNNPQL